MRVRVVGLLLVFAASAAPTPGAGQPFDFNAVDSHIDLASEHLREARFEQAVTAAEAGLALLGEPEIDEGRLRAVRLEVLAATAELAFGREEDARRRLVRALRNEPNLDLESSEASPKLLRALAAVREERGAPDVSLGPPGQRPQPRRSSRSRSRPRARAESVVLPADGPTWVALGTARAVLGRSLLALAGGSDPARMERWEIRTESSAEPVLVEIAHQRIQGRLHLLAHVRIAGDPEAELRLLSIESPDGAGADRILFRPASGRARRLGAEPTTLLSESLPIAFEDLRPPRLDDFELVSAWVDRLDGEPVWVVRARLPGEPEVDRVEFVLAERDGVLLARRWFRARSRTPFRTASSPRPDPDPAPDPDAHAQNGSVSAAGREWLLSDRERGFELRLRLVQRIAAPELDPGVFTLARLRGAGAPIPLPEAP